jgi:twitching motility protein PilT
VARVDAFLELAVRQKASDLHLVSGNPPRLRLDGEIHPIKYRELTPQETHDLVHQIMPERARVTLERAGNVDFAYVVPSIARFRVNVFQHLKGLGAVFRTIDNVVRSLQDLHMPPALQPLCRQSNGLILVTGPTGSGKTTTLAAMIEFINESHKGHILTVEDPIEYIHSNKGCLISQREVGSHTDTFADAVHSALREDPDVILVGEMRDLETVHMAMTAAETGVLVLGTLHTISAASTIDRIINVFAPGEQPYIRTMLSTSLRAVVCQRLLRRADGKGRVAAVEVMINNQAVANIIREGQTEQLDNVIQSGAMQGMQTLDGALRRLLDEGLINGEEAYRTARSKGYFKQYAAEYDENCP